MFPSQNCESYLEIGLLVLNDSRRLHTGALHERLLGVDARGHVDRLGKILQVLDVRGHLLVAQKEVHLVVTRVLAFNVDVVGSVAIVLDLKERRTCERDVRDTKKRAHKDGSAKGQQGMRTKKGTTEKRTARFANIKTAI